MCKNKVAIRTIVLKQAPKIFKLSVISPVALEACQELHQELLSLSMLQVWAGDKSFLQQSLSLESRFQNRASFYSWKWNLAFPQCIPCTNLATNFQRIVSRIPKTVLFVGICVCMCMCANTHGDFKCKRKHLLGICLFQIDLDLGHLISFKQM